MKKLALKILTVIVLLLSYSKNSSAQLYYCNPWECSPDPCYTIHFVNNTTCDITWTSYYGCTSGANPSFVVNGSTSPTWVLNCMKCDDNGPCECPSKIRLVDVLAGSVVEDWGDLISWTYTSAVFGPIPMTGCCDLKITIIPDPNNPNEGTVQIDCY